MLGNKLLLAADCPYSFCKGFPAINNFSSMILLSYGDRL